MPKSKGTPGGRIINLSPEEYEKILQYHLGKYNPDEDQTISRSKRWRFKERAKRFQVLTDRKEGGWPHGPQLYIERVSNSNSNSNSSSNTPSEEEEEMPYDVPFPLKRYVPQEKKKEVIGSYVTPHMTDICRLVSLKERTSWKKQNSSSDNTSTLWNY